MADFTSNVQWSSKTGSLEDLTRKETRTYSDAIDVPYYLQRPGATTAPATATKKTASVVKPKGFSDEDILGMIDDTSAESLTARQTQAVKGQTKAIEAQTASSEAEAAKSRSADLYLSAAKFGLDIMNANSAYNSIAGASRLNVLEARRKASDSIERGKQRALEARAEGQLEGESAILALAAQGQDVSGVNAQNVQGSLEAMGAQNALQEEINGIRESLGFELEEVAINYQMSQAATQRGTSILSSALQFGASYYGSTL